MSSVCVICGFASTGGSFFPGFAAPFFAAPPFFEVNNEGVSYLTRECSGGPGMSLKLTRLLPHGALREGEAQLRARRGGNAFSLAEARAEPPGSAAAPGRVRRPSAPVSALE